MIPSLNWLEIEHLTSLAAETLEGLFLDRVVVPERPEHAEGFLKNEWALRFSNPKREQVLIVSLRPRCAYFYVRSHPTLKAATHATHSAFDLALSKRLKGLKLEKIEALENERIAIFWFARGETPLGLILTLIPAHPEACLVEGPQYEIIAHSKLADVPAGSRWTPPSRGISENKFQLREEIVGTFKTLETVIEENLRSEALDHRARIIDRTLKEQLKTARSRIAQSTAALREAQLEPDWAHWGNLLKSVLHDPPPIQKDQTRKLKDFATDQWISIPCDPKKSLLEQAESYFRKSKKRSSKIDETQSRLTLSQQAEKTLLAKQCLLENARTDIQALLELENSLGIQYDTKSKQKKKAALAPGRCFRSKDGFEIRLGRSREENLELTLKHARGNDVWLHLRGRPSSHAIITVPPKKSAPLETLLDAAQLVLHYSGGQDWGKTEVDYTFRKYVKRIKGSDEVSYTHNKTLVISPEPERIRRLTQSESIV